MSIVSQIIVESRRYSGWIDPRYPIGYWQAALSLTGDASGGFLAIDLLFQQANGAPRLNSQMYSVERIAGSRDSGTSTVFSVATVNMAGPDNQGFQGEYTVPITGNSAGGRSGLAGGSLTFIPWFVGSQRTPGVSASLSFIGPNTNLVTVTFEAEGYRWGARSVLVDGGPQRPPTGLYRA